MPAQKLMSLCTGRVTPLAASVFALFGLTAESAIAATTHLVTDCTDGGPPAPGSLRAVINDPATLSGDTVDYSGSGCSIISLTTGALVVNQTDLNIIGSPDITIIGKYNSDRLFHHFGSGTLYFNNVIMGDAAYVSAAGGAFGGCIYSKGNVTLNHSEVAYCYAHGTGASTSAGGGAIAALNGVGLKYSQVIGSQATSEHSTSRGGGIIALTQVQAKYSTIAKNEAFDAGNTGLGGGIYVSGNLNLLHTTISGNTAGSVAGGIIQFGGSGATSTIRESTISGNTAAFGFVGGMLLTTVPTVTVSNSTIAFNKAQSANSGGKFYAPGLAMLTGSSTDVAAKFYSALISNNFYGTNFDFDFSQNPSNAHTITFDAASSGNLIRVPGAGMLPASTLQFTCPLLGTLRNNGGLTRTHAVSSGSVAINNGSNPNNDTTDQRGTGFPRVSDSGPDIGAYEYNKDDEVFMNQFDGCNPLS